MVSAGLGRWVVKVCGIDELPRFGTGCKNIELSKFKGGIPDSILYHISSFKSYYTILNYVYIYKYNIILYYIILNSINLYYFCIITY